MDSLLAPTPPTESTSMAFDALLKNWIAPSIDPIAVGVNFTFRSTLCPASKTRGSVRFDLVNSELLAVIPETVTLVSPLFVRVTSKASV